MKAAAFDYARPADARQAVALLAEAKRAGRFAKLLAGGQSLGPMLNMRLTEPELLIDISRAEDLTGAEGETLGAAVTHAFIEDGRIPDPTGGILPPIARGIAYRAVRNRGTIGGSLAHGDPAADWLTALAALGAEVEVLGPAGGRRLAVERLPTGAFRTALGEDELITCIHVAAPGPGARWGFHKIARKSGDYALAIGAVLLDPERGIVRAVIGAMEAPPLIIADAAERLFGGRISHGTPIDHYDEAAAADLIDRTPLAADAYERRIHLVALRRAVRLAGIA